MDLALQLQKIGLSKPEAAVFLASLKLGVSKASEIARKAGIKREAAYYILKTLQEKGYISEVIKSGVKHYSAIKPQRLLGIIEEEKQKKAEAVTSILPELEALQKVAITKPSIEVYEGVDGFKTVVAKLVEKKNQTLYAYVPENIMHFIPTFHAQFRRRRKEKNIFHKAITAKTEYMQQAKKQDKEENREIRSNDNIMKKVETAYFILEDAVIHIKANKKEQLGVYIKDQSMARLQRNVFEKVWRESK